MRSYIRLLVTASFLPFVVPLAVYADHVTSQGVTLNLGDSYTLEGGSVFHELVPDGGTAYFSIDSASRIEMSSSDRRMFNSSYQVPTTCEASQSRATWKFPDSGAQSMSITPSGSCPAVSTGGSGASGGGGSGGGGAATPPAPPAVVAAPTPQTVAKVTELKSTLAQLQTQVQKKIAEESRFGAAPLAFGVFARDLAAGQRDDEVKRLQQLLSRDKDIYPEGLATGYYGPATVRAVKRFQEKHGLSAVGRVGPQTRAKLSDVFGVEAPAPAPVPVPTQIPAVPVGAAMITKTLDPGQTNDEVKTLQQLLSRDKDIYPEGLATGYYGPATVRAVKRFQEKHGLSAVGRVGPQTKTKLNDVFGGAAPAPVPAPVPTPAAPPAAVTPPAATGQTQSIQEQLQALQAKLLQEQVKLLQEKIKALQPK